MMLNCYPWGVSLNQMQPLSKSKTRILFETYLFDVGNKDKIEETAILQTEMEMEMEMEDEQIVLQVPKGIESSAYAQGRYSPKHE